jgi:hypothetical protein
MNQKIEENNPKQSARSPDYHGYHGQGAGTLGVMDIGQNSPNQPAAIWEEGGEGPSFHMVFTSNDGTNRIFYATSPDGLLNWTLGPDTGQISSAAPALAQYIVFTGGGGLNPPTITTNLLVLVFVATNSSNLIQYAILDLTENPNYRAWRFGGSLGREIFARTVTVYPTFPGGDPLLTVYFTSNDATNTLAEYSFIPQ